MTSFHIQFFQKSFFRRNVFIFFFQNDDLRSDFTFKIVKDRADQHVRKIQVVFFLRIQINQSYSTIFDLLISLLSSNYSIKNVAIMYNY